MYTYPRLPLRVPTHWNAHGQINGYGPRWMATAIFPCMLIVVWGLMRVLPKIDPWRANYAKMQGAYDVVVNAVLSVLALAHVSILGATLGAPISIDRIIPFAVSVMFIVISNVLPRARPNFWFGIRTPWTLTNPRVWERTHRVGGYVMVVAGVLGILASFASFEVANSAMGALGGMATALITVTSSYLPGSEGDVSMKRTMSALLTLLPVALAAQAPDRASYYLVVHALGGTDTVIAERVTRTPTELTGEFVDRTRGGRVSYSATLSANALVTRLETRVRSATDTAAQTASFTIDGDSIVARMGSAAPAHVPAVTGALAIVNPSVAFIEQMVRRALASSRPATPWEFRCSSSAHRNRFPSPCGAFARDSVGARLCERDHAVSRHIRQRTGLGRRVFRSSK